MITKRYVHLVVFFTLVLSLQAQVQLQREEISGRTYRLLFENTGSEHQTLQKDARQYLIFPMQADSSQAPSRDLFIALPDNATPAIQFNITRQNTLNNVSLFERTELVQRNTAVVSRYIPSQKGSQNFIVMGYLRMQGSYCLHLRVFPYTTSAGTGSVNHLQEFELLLDLKSADQLAGPSAAPRNDVPFINKEYGSRWRTDKGYPASAATDGWIQYSQDYVKIGVVRDAVYKISYNDLKNMGVPVTTLNPKTFSMFLKGKPLPITVIGEGNNVFDSTDYIEFVGRRNYGSINYRSPAAFGSSYNEFLNRYSDTTIYWLTWNGADGLRADTVVSSPSATPDTTQYYDHLSRIEDNRFWDFSLYGGDLRKNDPDLLENETWNESVFGVGKTTKLLSVSNLYPSGTAKAFVKVQTSSSNAGDFEPKAHRLAIQVNTLPTMFDSGDVAKYQVKTLTAAFSSSVLFNGANSINVNSFSTSYSLNSMYVDWWEFEYPRYLRTTNDEMIFNYRTLPTPKYSTIAVKGITSASYSVYRFRPNDSSITRIVASSKRNDTIRFTDSLKEGNQYFLAGSSRITAPIYYGKKQFVNLRSASNTAEYIAVTHPYFRQSAQNYSAFIASTYGVTTKVVLINDIFDEFNYGFPAPEPIRDFFRSAVALWQAPKPRHVFMIGKTTYDYFGNKTRYFGAPVVQNFVPSYGNPVSDNWFVTWDSTQALIPQLNIGRLPVGTIAEFDGYFLKHQKYTSKGYDEWNKRYLFFSGGNFITPGQVTQLKAVNDFIIDTYVKPSPVGGYRSNFYKTESPETNFGPYSIEHVQNEIEQGGMMISYVGHSATQTWDNSITDIDQLANIRDRNPIITDFGCSTAKHAEPDILSFSELAVSKTKGQAMVYIANSALGFTSTAYSFPQYFYRNLLDDTIATLGEVHTKSKIQYTQSFGSSGTYGLFLRTNTIIGDPIVTIPKPQRPNLTFSNTVHTILQERVTESIDSVTIRVPFRNLGVWKSDSLRFSVTETYNGVTVPVTIPARALPLNDDTVTFAIPVKGKPGEHTVSLTLDPANTVTEIYENDNTYSLNVIVASNSIRTFAFSPELHQTSGRITFINPAQTQQSPTFNVDISLSKDFSSSQKMVIPYDTLFTEFQLDGSYSGKRVWLRTKLSDTASGGLIYSYRAGSKDNYLLNDSLAFASTVKTGLKMQGVQMVLDTEVVNLQVISAGFSDGSNATIFKNGDNLVADILRRAYHVCIFDSATLGFLKYVRFDIVGGNAATIDSFKTLIDTSTSKYLFAIALANNGASSNLNASLKASIRSIGSRYIDSIVTNASWGMIGYKGAAAGSVPEGFRKQFTGRVQIETTIIVPKKRGSFSTGPIGPVNRWHSIETQFTATGGSELRLGVIGRSASTQQEDTLLQGIPADSVISITSVDAQQYPIIRAFGLLTAGSLNNSPRLNSIAVNYTMLPELGANYQTFKGFHMQDGAVGPELSSADSIPQGERLKFRYRIYNAGETAAKNVPVKLSSIWENNTVETVDLRSLDSIPAKSFREVEAEYNTSLGSGRRTIQLNIDPDTTVREIYRDNNFYTFPIIIKKSQGNPLLPNLSIAQNAVTSLPAEITDETDTARFTIIYSNTGSLVNDSISIQVKHYYQSELLSTSVIRRKYPVSYDTLTVKIPVLKNAGQHQLTIDLDHTGLIVESSESDNSSSYFFTVATTDFKVLFPTQNSISSVDKIIFLNPTTAGAASVVTMELDTLSAFTTAQTFSKTLQPFATTFPLPDLKKKKRYFWRAKVQGSPHDWTVGSFYSGDSAGSSLGQIDSVAWKQNIYTRTSFSPDSGARIVDTRTIIKASSAGFNDGNIGSVTVNGINIITPIIGSGHNLVVLDSTSFAVESLRRFNITSDPNEADSLVQFIGAVAAGKYVIDVIVDEGANNLHTAARNALKSIGSTKIDQVAFRDSWSIIGRKGVAPGTVTETYRAQNSGSAMSETTIVRAERTGTIETPLIGPFSSLSALSVDQVIPHGAQITVQLIGVSPSKSLDTLLTVQNQSVISLASVNTKVYRNGKLVFRLTAPPPLRTSKRTAAVQSPSVMSWKMTAQSSTELAVSSGSTTIDRNQVMEGEQIQFSAKVFNVSNVPADSVLVQLKTNASGIDNVLMQQRYVRIPANDSVSFSFGYDTRGKRGNHSFMFEIDPKDSLSEQSKSNNTVSVPYIVQADTLRPTLQITFDGNQVLNGDHVSRQPEIKVRFTDNNPAGILASDTSNFRIRLNNQPVHFIAGTAELTGSSTAGRADVRWTPTLQNGENIIQISAKDVSENYSDTILLYVNVASEFMIMDLFNLPNPFTSQTAFTFNLAGPRNPDEVIIKIYTVAGRLIQEMNVSGIIGFNKIPWDGRDKDGDQIGNGVYLYKVIIKQGEKQIESISKLVKMR